jgi:hypothetical protein
MKTGNTSFRNILERSHSCLGKIDMMKNKTFFCSVFEGLYDAYGEGRIGYGSCGTREIQIIGHFMMIMKGTK